jgi:uncharacterized protein (TIGR02677 family)
MAESIRVFAHLDAPNADAYRAVLAVFVEAKERFRLHLRPDEIAQGLSKDSDIAPDALEPLLSYLVDHGNLIATADRAEVRTVDDFYRARFLYQLSRSGEAAEEALALFHARLEAPGELQTQALADIRTHLAALETLLATSPDDVARIHQTISLLFARFAGLAEQARAFIGSLQRSLDLQAAPVEDFLGYKEHLIGYLERFLTELAVASGDVVARLDRLTSAGIEAGLDRAADRDVIDQLRQDDDARAATRSRWHRHWHGLRSWFISDGTPPQAQLLRNCTRAAIPALLHALDHLHDRRLKRSDRVADFRTLARWFSLAPNDDYAHTLWHAAFLLSPCRHLTVDELTLTEREASPVPASTSWLDAPPMRIHPRLRSTGRLQTPGRRPIVLDHGMAKAELRRRLAAESEQIAQARHLITSGHARRLSEFAALPDSAFAMLLDCLGAALARRTDPQGIVQCTSGDGSFLIICEPIANAPEAVITCSSGTFRGPDLMLTISESWSAGGAA